jgi:hypothetical protein
MDHDEFYLGESSMIEQDISMELDNVTRVLPARERKKEKKIEACWSCIVY